jgi:hypothetical protein
MTADTADRSLAMGRKFGNELPGSFFIAVRASGVFSFASHGLEQNEVLAAGFAYVLIKRHDYNSFRLITIKLTFAALAGAACVKYNTQGAETCQGKNREHCAHKSRKQEPIGVHEKPQKRASEYKNPG